jgi:hypothetical protein
MSDFICSTRNLLSQGFRSLPVILGGSVLLLGLLQSNFNLLFFFTGLFLITPIAATILNGVCELLFSLTPIPQSLWIVPGGGAEACSIFTSSFGSSTPINSVPSYWMSMIGFFFSYLFFNAYTLYTKQGESKAPQEAIMARKSQAVMSMILLSAIGILFTIMRYGTSCETAIGILVSWLLGGGLAYGWYEFMKRCGMGRLDDLFGISNRILPMQSYEDNEPSVCVPASTT